MRTLVTIRTVKDVVPIAEADAIEVVKIDGWQCVSKKDEFKVGDQCLYFEVDSFLPIEDRFEFLRKSSYKKLINGQEGFRLRTVRLRGQLSQGLALPLSLFPNLDLSEDLAQQLNVIKYDPPLPACLSGQAKGNFPSFIRKTDQERIQNLTEYFELYKDLEFEETEKEDGSSMTVFYNDQEFGVCSRNLELKDVEGNTHWRLAKELELEKKLRELKQNIAIQGELIGEGIQSNKMKILKQKFRVFDIFNIDEQRYLTQSERAEILCKLNLESVPILNAPVKIFQECFTIDLLLERAEGTMKLNDKSQREGLVYKSCSLVNGQTISFKVINNKFLLKYQE